MKYIIAVVACAMLSFTSVDNLSDISRALNSGNADELSPYLHSQVELAILGSGKIYAKTDAIKVIQEFVDEHKPVKFNLMHEGSTSKANCKYCIGNLEAGGKSYRVYMFIEIKDGRYKIQEIRIE